MKWLKNLFRKKRSDTDRLVCTLDSMVFVLLHTNSNLNRWLVQQMYASIPREAVNGRLESIEMKMALLHERVSQELEERSQELRLPE